MEQIEILLSSLDLTEKERVSVKTIVKVFMRNPKCSAYNKCKYSYQNIVDRFSSNEEPAQSINNIMKGIGCYESFKIDIMRSRADKYAMSGSTSPGYSPINDSDIDILCSAINNYTNIQPNDTVYSYIPLKQIVALFQARGLVFKEMSTQDKLKLPMKLVEKKKRYFYMPWTTYPEARDLWSRYSEWTQRKRNVTDIAVCVELDSKTLLRAIWKKSHDADAYIVRDSKKQAKPGYNVKAVLAADRSAFTDGKRSLEVRFSPKGVFRSYAIDPRVTSQQRREILMILKHLGIADKQIKNKFCK